MEFGRAHSRLISTTEPSVWRLIVALETNASVSTIRDERVTLLPSQTDASSACWTLDQYTQETIGTTLAGDGWEPIGLGSEDEVDRCEQEQSMTWVVRRL